MAIAIGSTVRRKQIIERIIKPYARFGNGKMMKNKAQKSVETNSHTPYFWRSAYEVVPPDKNAVIWSTPQAVFDKLDAEFHFTVDLCADHFNRKCEKFIPTNLTLASDVLWEGNGWLNPPYGKSIGAFLAKAVHSTHDRMGTVIVALVPTRTNAPWWHEWVMRADEIRFIRKKLAFDASNGHRGVPFTGHAIVVFCNRGLPTLISSWEQP